MDNGCGSYDPTSQASVNPPQNPCGAAEGRDWQGPDRLRVFTESSVTLDGDTSYIDVGRIDVDGDIEIRMTSLLKRGTMHLNRESLLRLVDTLIHMGELD